MRTLPAATIALTALFLALATVPATAKTCKSWGFVGQAVASTKPEALVMARLNWAVKVDSYWGQAWRNYNIAKNKSEQCQAAGGASLKQRCTAEAIPCRP